jgi:hypothetical protein
MAGTAQKIRSPNKNDASRLINTFNSIGKLVYKYVYLKRVGNIYSTQLCIDENDDCDTLAIHGVLIDFESISKQELGDEIIINGEFIIYYEWDPCRSKRYLLIAVR